uniref:hypothetical protein n=1 Tax=uncultured Kiloniella sp. TaxID=1133091 RepID=UPI00260FF626
IKLAEWEYLCTYASDGYYNLEKIRKQVDYLENNPFYGLCYSNRYKFYENGIVRKLPVNDIQEGYLFSELLTQKIRVNPCTIMYRMEVIHDIGLYDVTLAVEDFDYILRVAYKYKIGFLDDYLFYYRSHANNTVNLTDKMQINSNLILGKWVHTSSYQEAVFLNDLQYFRAFASLQKTKAIKLMPLYKGVIYRREFYEGLLRLLIPKFIYKAIMRR